MGDFDFVFKWTDENIQLLKDLFAKGLSYAQIGAELGAPNRNIIAGKLKRLGLKKGNGHYIPKGEGTKKKVYVRKDTALAIHRRSHNFVSQRIFTKLNEPRKHINKLPPDAELLKCSIMGLTNANCHWPLGDPIEPNFAFCGCPVVKAPYCNFHYRMSRAKPAERNNTDV